MNGADAPYVDHCVKSSLTLALVARAGISVINRADAPHVSPCCESILMLPLVVRAVIHSIKSIHASALGSCCESKHSFHELLHRCASCQLLL